MKERNKKLESIIKDYLWNIETYGGEDAFEFRSIMNRADIYQPSKWFDYWLMEGIGEGEIVLKKIIKKAFEDKEEAEELGVEFDFEARIKAEAADARLKAAKARKEKEKWDNDEEIRGRYTLGNAFLYAHIEHFNDSNAETLEEFIEKLNKGEE